MTSEVKKETMSKRRAVIYYQDSPNGILLQAEDNKPDINELNQWIRTYIALPKGKYYEFGMFVIPTNEWDNELYARLCIDFDVRPLCEAHGWVGRLDKTELLSRAADGLGLDWSVDAIHGRMTIFLE